MNTCEAEKNITDLATKCIIEGCIFINPRGLQGNSGLINGIPARNCSKQQSSENQKIKVYIKNNDTTNSNSKDVDVWTYDINVNEPLCKWDIFASKEKDLFDKIDNAVVYVTHNNWEEDSIVVECISVVHRLNIEDLDLFSN